MITSLRSKTYELLKNRNNLLTLKKITEDTGISEQWLSRFNQNQIKNPSVDIVQTLYQYLTNTELVI